MTSFFLTLHMVSMCLVIGTMFLQSLSVVFRLRLKSPEEIAGVRKVQNRIHKFIYYPILFVTVASGFTLAVRTDLLGKDEQWIYLKILLLLLLVTLGVLNGKQIKSDFLPKKYAMMVHIGIFIIGGWIIYLATIKPF